jgi:hypothetical protein
MDDAELRIVHPGDDYPKSRFQGSVAFIISYEVGLMMVFRSIDHMICQLAMKASERNSAFGWTGAGIYQYSSPSLAQQWE